MRLQWAITCASAQGLGFGLPQGERCLASCADICLVEREQPSVLIVSHVAVSITLAHPLFWLPSPTPWNSWSSPRQNLSVKLRLPWQAGVEENGRKPPQDEDGQDVLEDARWVADERSYTRAELPGRNRSLVGFGDVVTILTQYH